MTNSVEFLVNFWVRTMSFGFGDDNRLEFQSSNPPINVVLKATTQEDMNIRGVGTWCQLRRSFTTDESSAKFISSLCKRVYLKVPGAPLELPHDHDGIRLIDENGEIHPEFFVQRRMLPPEVITLFDFAFAELTRDQAHFIKTLRWKNGLGGAPQPYEGPPTVCWSALGSSYEIAPYQPFPAFWRNPVEISWNKEIADEFENVWQMQVNEPTGHELLREAESLLSTAHKSALLIGVSALEAGTKAHLMSVLPRTDALFTHIPSPPLDKLLKIVLSEVHPELTEWRKMPLLKHIQPMAESRNALTHRGAEIDREKVADYLDVIHDILYILDALRGHAWAKRLLYSQEAMDFLGWPGPALARVQFRWAH